MLAVNLIKQKLSQIKPNKLILISVGRLTLISIASFGLATLQNWGNHQKYWYGTIFAVQTVDFNILYATLPTKLSYTLLQRNTEELQRTLDSNYGLFGLLVTDCKTAAQDCPSEKILYQSKSSQKWAKEISLANLSNHPYDLLQSPPPLQAERQYAKPYDSKPTPTGRVNSGEIIGRVYYVRGVPQTFIEDYNNWIKEPFHMTGVRPIYALTTALFLIGGLSAWVIIEVVLSAKRNEQRLAQQQREQLQREAEYEQRLAQQQREQLQRKAEYEQHLAQQQREQLQREIQQIKLELEAKNQQTIKLIKQRERGLAELESYRQEQEQNKRELENQIASYERELAFKEQQQQETVQTLEDLQLLRQELQETYQRESEAKQQIKLQLEEKNQQNIELIDQRDRVLAELESDRQEQEQNKRELENQIASYESELAFKEQQQQETAQTLEDLQLLRQKLQETSQRESEAKQQIKLQLEEKNQQNIELIDQRDRGLAELESDRQKQEQNKRELENQIASYESELAFKEQQQQETAQTLEDLQLLRQKLQETSRRESEAKQQSNELNAALEGSRAELEQIKALSRDSETYLLKESLRLEEENAYLEGYRAELERIKEQSRDENYYVEEIDRLEKEKSQLNSELDESKSQTQFLEYRNRQLDRELSAAQENTQILENNIELQNLSQNSHSGIPWSQLPRISGRQAIGSLECLGFIRQHRGGGSHVVLKRVVTLTSSCSVPLHDELDYGTLASSLRQANVTLEDFLNNL